MNTLPSRHKCGHVNLTMYRLYLVNLKIAQNGRPFTAVRSVELIVPNFHRKSFNVRFFTCLLENSFRCLLTENSLHWHGVFS